MSSKSRLLIRVAFFAVRISIIVLSVIFGVNLLQNIHSEYIRYKSKDVVMLLNERQGGGTGFVVKAKSGKLFILTNRHICRSTRTGMLVAIYRDKPYTLNIVKEYTQNDLCLVEAPSVAKDYLRIARTVTLGEKAYAVGHPLLEPITVTEGELSSVLKITMPVGQNVDPADCSGPGFHLEDLSENPFAAVFGIINECFADFVCNSSTISIQPGNSGSPVLDIYGQVIGVAFAANEAGSHSYVVPLNSIKDFLNDY